MGYSQFLNMIPEALLVLALIIVFFADFCLHKSERKVGVLGKLTAALLLCQTIMLTTVGPAEAFGGMYVAGQAAQVMKLILTFGTFIVVVMSEPWLENEARRYAGEFHLLVLSTLLGMYIMMSSGSFLIFFLGLETASVPMACLVAFDKYKKKSAEAAAKYILVATFSSGVMLYGISFIYAATGTLYFDDAAQVLNGSYLASPLSIMGLVFFFSGLAFKLSLVPFHFWTADTYEGAPTPITGYLSVCSKGAAAFAALVILMKAFGPMIEYWEYMLYVVIVLSITIANLFAIRQSELKRFMAFSSISQAGYIMLAVIGGSQTGHWWFADGHGFADVLHPRICRCQHGRLHRYLCRRECQRSASEPHVQRSTFNVQRLRRPLPDQPQAGVPHDAGPVLAGWYSSVRRYVL